MKALALIALLLTSSSPMEPQSWRELYDRGDFKGAAGILHSRWNEMMREAPAGIDLEVLEALGRLYQDGRGVEADVSLACSYFEHAVAEASGGYSDNQKAVEMRMTELRDRACRQLSADARREVSDSLGCPRFGSDVYTFALGPGRQMRTDRHSTQIQHGDHRHTESFPMQCGSRLALVRHTRLEGDRARSHVERDLVEAFVWSPGRKPGHRALNWYVSEIVDTKIAISDVVVMDEQPGTMWEPAQVPAELLAVTFARAKDGDISWRFDHAPFEGILPALNVEIAPEAAADPPPLPETGNHNLEVQVLDRFGAPLAGVDVKLDGVVVRSAKTDLLGVTSFEQLPGGRYDVVATSKGLAPNRPRVLDLPQTQDRVSLTLKPFAPTVLASIGCGMMGALTLESLGTMSDLVLHVRVDGQQAVELDGSQGFVTRNRAGVLRAFKSAGAPLAEVTIPQPGGTIDREDMIQAHMSGNLAPLNVGDEYVVFLRRQESGQLVLAHLEESVFLIRNGRVYPAGRGRVAVAWKKRSAERFFDALRARVR